MSIDKSFSISKFYFFKDSVPGYDFYYSVSQIGYLQRQAEEFQNDIQAIDFDVDEIEEDLVANDSDEETNLEDDGYLSTELTGEAN